MAGVVALAFASLLPLTPLAADDWKSLFDGKTLSGWKKVNFGGEGEIEIEDRAIVLGYGQSMTGIQYTKPFPKLDYEIRLEAKRVGGTDFFCGLTFPVADTHCSFILGGWGGAVVGLSSLDDRDASENETGQAMALEDNRWYKVRVRVTDGAITVWLDDKQIIDVQTRGRKISTRVEVDLCKPLGISSWETRAALRKIEYRRLPREYPDPLPPQVAPASNQPRLSLGRMQLAEGLVASLFAAEPDVANIVAFDVDDQGRVYVCESFRQVRGIEDNRNHMDWLDDDLAAMRVADRLTYLKKRLGDRLADYTRYDDRIRLLSDDDGDGVADRSSVFADHFNGPLDGTGASVLAWGKDVFYTCIPHLWRLKDDDGDGRADLRMRLHSGFGVRYAFRGHDLHGLTRGPDGRLYFSIGDRGFRVETPSGILANPESGAILRCERDGSNLEVIATGLRNPQELAFDDFGNLFTGDNNSDSGDRARMVYVLPGMDAGWRMAYQYLPDRGPFNRERIWHPFRQDQPAFIVPPIANFADGPSGFTYYPGTGWSDSYRGTFFLCDFRGSPDASGIRTFRVEPQGAMFSVVDSRQPIWKVLATDAQFGPDGALYVSDWVDGWIGEGKGRIYRVVHRDAASDPRVTQVRQLLRNGMNKLPPDQLVNLLEHADQRIRLRAQWELADRACRPRRGASRYLQRLIDAARSGPSVLARIHGIWGWEQVIRKTNDTGTLGVAVELLADGEAEVRAQVAKLIGAAGYGEGVAPLVERLSDPVPRVRLYAALALAEMRRPFDATPVFRMLAQADNEDPALRHGGVMALVALRQAAELWKQYESLPGDLRRSDAVRLALVVALRRLRSPDVARLLDDSSLPVVEEAARAIHDVPISAAWPMLAELLEQQRIVASDATLRRAINANVRLGDEPSALRLASFASREGSPQKLRVAALELLSRWAEPSSRDWVLGMWRPINRREARPAKEAVTQVLARLLESEADVRWAAIQAAASLGISKADRPLRDLLQDSSGDPEQRAVALRFLARLGPDDIANVLSDSLHDRAYPVRQAALELLAMRNPQQAVGVLKQQLAGRNAHEMRTAFEILAKLPDELAAPLLTQAVKRLAEGKIPLRCQVELLEAASRSPHPGVKRALGEYNASLPSDDALARYRPALVGGLVWRGRNIFRHRIDVSCQRCHTIAGSGGAVGPDLTKIGAEKTAEYLLESIVDPNRQIAKGFDSVVILDADGKVHTGVLKSEDEAEVKIMTAEGVVVAIRQDDIEARKVGKSAMPDDVIEHLSLRDLRDLVAFLKSLKSAPELK